MYFLKFLDICNFRLLVNFHFPFTYLLYTHHKQGLSLFKYFCSTKFLLLIGKIITTVEMKQNLEFQATIRYDVALPNKKTNNDNWHESG